MNKFITLVAICMVLATATAFAATQKIDKQVVKTEAQSDILSVKTFEVYYISEATLEVIPELICSLDVGKVEKGFKSKVYHPPSLINKNPDNLIRRL